MQLHDIQSGAALHLLQFLEGRIERIRRPYAAGGAAQPTARHKLCGLLSINLSAAGREDEADIIDRQMLRWR